MPHTCVTLKIAILQAVYDGGVYFAVQSSGVCTCVEHMFEHHLCYEGASLTARGHSISINISIRAD